MNTYPKPLPRQDDRDNAPYWAAARQHRFILQRCGGCGRFRFPAAQLCPACRSMEGCWEEAGRTGVVESFCRFHKAYWPGFAQELPYTVIQVLLDNGVRMYSNLAADTDQAAIGTRVEVSFDDVTPEVTIVKFRPLA